MKILFILGFILLLQACKSTNTNKEHEQTFICKSLIQGYLNTQQLGQYQFHKKIEANLKTVYVYTQPTVSGSVLGIQQHASLKFECLNPSKDILELKLIAPFQRATSVLSLHIIPKNLL